MFGNFDTKNGSRLSSRVLRHCFKYYRNFQTYSNYLFKKKMIIQRTSKLKSSTNNMKFLANVLLYLSHQNYCTTSHRLTFHLSKRRQRSWRKLRDTYFKLRYFLFFFDGIIYFSIKF